MVKSLFIPIHNYEEVLQKFNEVYKLSIIDIAELLNVTPADLNTKKLEYNKVLTHQ